MAKLGLGNGPLAGVLALSLAAAFVGCSSKDNGSTLGESGGDAARSGSGGGSTTGGAGTGGVATGGSGSSSGGGTGGASGGTGGSGSGASSGGNPPISTEACPGMPVEEGSAGAAGADQSCTGTEYEPERMPVDMFIMLDRSISMIEHTVEVEGEQVTRWEAVTRAVEQFVSDPAAADIRMGLGIFSYSGSANEAVECQASNYSTPKIEIGSPAEVGDEIVAYIRNLESSGQLGGFTPTQAALKGAIMHAKDWASANLMRKTVVVLVTDGLPTQCSTDVSAIAQVAAEGNTQNDAGPPVSTYVVGVQGAWNLSQIAMQGGTEAFVVGKEGDAAAQFVDALINITDSPILCEYDIANPDDPEQVINFDKVSLLYTPTATGAMEEVPRVNGMTDCASSEFGGWYYIYGPDGEPSKIAVCPCTCARFGVGRMSLRIGCDPRWWLG